MIQKCVLTLCLIIFAACTQAASVWKVSKEGKELFIGGTVHLLSKADYPLPEEYDQAYQLAQSLVFETDEAALSTEKFQMQMMKQLSYKDGRTIKSVLSDRTYKALENHLATRNIPIQNLIGFKPGMVSVTLSVIELQRIGLTSEGVDKYYANLATLDKKSVNWLETPQQQLDLIANMGKGDEDDLIAYTLKDLKSLPEMISKLKQYWRDGDMGKMADIGIRPFVEDYPEVYADLLLDRNKRWVPQIEAMLKNDEKELVLVGALHLAGPHSVLKMLSDKGYKVEKF